MRLTVGQVKDLCRGGLQRIESEPFEGLLRANFLAQRGWVGLPIIEDARTEHVVLMRDLALGQGAQQLFLFPGSESWEDSIRQSDEEEALLTPLHHCVLEGEAPVEAYERALTRAMAIYMDYFVTDDRLSVVGYGVHEIAFVVAGAAEHVSLVVGSTIEEAFDRYRRDIEDWFGDAQYRWGYESAQRILNHYRALYDEQHA